MGGQGEIEMETKIEIEKKADKLFLELPNKKYKIIYADPPWEYEFAAKKENKNITGCANQHYKTMSLSEIKKLPIPNISDKDCALFLWTTFPQIENALDLIDSWGFKYKTVAFTWIKKTNMGKFAWGCGFWTRSNAEICLLATKGKPKRIANNVHQIILSKRKKHSEKPKETYIKIEKLMGDLPRIELFARTRFEGWDCWGDQLSDTVQKTFNEVD